MTKRLVEIDDTLLDAARELLGTATIKDTVHEALTEVVAAVMRRQEIEWLKSGAMEEFMDPDMRERVWQSSPKS